LKITSVLACRLQAVFSELASDIVPRKPDAVAINVATGELVRSEVADMLAQRVGCGVNRSFCFECPGGETEESQQERDYSYAAD
jgi:hypothetical protein